VRGLTPRRGRGSRPCPNLSCSTGKRCSG
jgi:hypothetical protein